MCQPTGRITWRLCALAGERNYGHRGHRGLRERRIFNREYLHLGHELWSKHPGHELRHKKAQKDFGTREQENRVSGCWTSGEQG